MRPQSKEEKENSEKLWQEYLKEKDENRKEVKRYAHVMRQAALSARYGLQWCLI